MHPFPVAMLSPQQVDSMFSLDFCIQNELLGRWSEFLVSRSSGITGEDSEPTYDTGYLSIEIGRGGVFLERAEWTQLLLLSQNAFFSVFLFFVEKIIIDKNPRNKLRSLPAFTQIS